MRIYYDTVYIYIYTYMFVFRWSNLECDSRRGCSWCFNARPSPTRPNPAQPGPTQQSLAQPGPSHSNTAPTGLPPDFDQITVGHYLDRIRFCKEHTDAIIKMAEATDPMLKHSFGKWIDSHTEYFTTHPLHLLVQMEWFHLLMNHLQANYKPLQKIIYCQNPP